MSEVNVSDKLFPRAHESRRDIPREPVNVFAARLIIRGLLLVTAVLKVISTTESAAVAVAYQISPLLTAAVVQVELASLPCC